MSTELDSNEKRWKGLVRASILSATTHKLYRYVGLADQKAMGLIVMNSIIIPVAMSGIDDVHFKIAATLAIFTSVLSIFFAILCIFPQRGVRDKADRGVNVLHFNDIGNMARDEYLDIMQPLYNDTTQLGQAVLCDIHDVSRRVLIPKFKLLKIAYSAFFIGNLFAVVMFLISIWSV